MINEQNQTSEDWFCFKASSSLPFQLLNWVTSNRFRRQVRLWSLQFLKRTFQCKVFTAQAKGRQSKFWSLIGNLIIAVTCDSASCVCVWIMTTRKTSFLRDEKNPEKGFGKLSTRKFSSSSLDTFFERCWWGEHTSKREIKFSTSLRRFIFFNFTSSH